MSDGFENQAFGPQGDMGHTGHQYGSMSSADAMGNPEIMPEAPQQPAPEPPPAYQQQPVAQEGTDPLAQPAPDPALEEMRRKMIATQTRLTQQLNAEKRELEQQRRHYEQMVAQMSGGQRAQQEESLLDFIPEATRRQIGPEGEQVLQSIDYLVQQRLKQLEANIPKSEVVSKVEQEVMSLRNELQTRERTAQAQQLISKYGEVTVAPYAEEIADMINRNPQLSMERAFIAVAPQAYEQYVINTHSKKAREQANQARVAQLHGGIPGPSAPSRQGFMPGESMADSFKAVGGKV